MSHLVANYQWEIPFDRFDMRLFGQMNQTRMETTVRIAQIASFAIVLQCFGWVSFGAAFTSTDEHVIPEFQTGLCIIIIDTIRLVHLSRLLEVFAYRFQIIAEQMACCKRNRNGSTVWRLGCIISSTFAWFHCAILTFGIFLGITAESVFGADVI